MRSLPKHRPTLAPSAVALASLYVCALLAPLLLAALAGVESAGSWSETATALGMVGAVMLLLQLVSSGRFEALSGRIGIDLTMAFHKWAARLMILVILLHPLIFLLPVSLDRLDVAANHLLAMLGSPRYLSGVVALSLVVVVVGLALARDRLPVPYEAWRATHGLLAFAASGATLDHLLNVGTYSSTTGLLAFWLVLALAAAAAALGVYTIRAWRMHRQGWRVETVRRLADQLWKVTLVGMPDEALSFRAGQFAWLAFAPHRFPLFDHPFSIASSPGDGSRLSFVVREAGDFTNGIGALAIGTPVGLDTPHGSFTLEGVDAESLLLIAGGVGVAPIMSLLGDLADRGDRRPVRLVYGARSPSAMIDPDVFRPMLERLEAKVIFTVDQTPPNWPHQIGPITRSLLEEALSGLDPRRVVAMVCGPSAMMAAVTDSLHALGLPYGSIRYERFDYVGGPSSGKDRRLLAGLSLMLLAVAAGIAAFAFR